MRWNPQRVHRFRRLCTVIFLAGACAGAKGAVYYVDFDAGSDSASGSMSSPWKHSPGDPNAAGVPNSTALNGGDTVKFKGGVVYRGSLRLSRSGTTGNPIVYDGNLAGDWGTGKAVIDGDYRQDAVGINVGRGVSNIKVQNFEIRNFGGYPDDASNVVAAAAGTYTNVAKAMGTGIDASLGANTNLVFSALYINRIGNWRSSIGWDGNSVCGNGIFAADQYSLTITNCELTRVGFGGIGIYAKPNLRNVLITDCYLHDNINWAMDVSVQQAGGIIDGVTITKSRLMNLNQMGGDFKGPNSDAVHQNYIFMRTVNETTPWTNVFVTRCLFGETSPSPGGTGGTGAIFLSSGPSCNIYNNIFARSWSTTGVIPIGYPTPVGLKQIVRIYNNTFYRGCVGAAINLTGETTDRREVYVENNVFVSDSTTAINNADVIRDANNGPVIMDYDVFFAESYPVDQKYVFVNGGPYLRFPALATLGLEAHGTWADPKFASVQNRDFRPGTGSPLVGRGRNLSAFFTTDFDGKIRPSTGAWSVGAFEASTTPVPGSATFSATPASLDFGTVQVGGNVQKMIVLRNTGTNVLTGSVSVGNPFKVLSGGDYNLTTQQTQLVTVAYSPQTTGSNFAELSFSGGSGNTVQLAGMGNAQALTYTNGLSLPAAAGVISAPFLLTNSYVVQDIQTTDPASAGKATYTFAIQDSDTYSVGLVVNAPALANNSIFLNMDTEPTSPLMIWDIPVTTGFETRWAKWRGTGTDENSEFPRKAFQLSAGTHQLIIRGREANVQIQRIIISKVPIAPSEIRPGEM